MRAKLNTPPRVKIFYRRPEDDSGNPPVVPRLPARAGRGGRRERRPLAPSSLRAGARVGRVKRARGLRYRRSNGGGRSSAAQPAHQPFPVPGRQPPSRGQDGHAAAPARGTWEEKRLGSSSVHRARQERAGLPLGPAGLSCGSRVPCQPPGQPQARWRAP